MLIIMNECMLSIDIQNKPEFIYYENLYQISMFSSISALIDSQSAKALVCCRMYVLCAMYTLLNS